MKPTCDLYDDHLDAVHVLPVGLQHFGGRVAFHGPVETVACFEDNSLIRKLSETPGEGRVMLVDAGGSLRCAVIGDMLAERAMKNGWAGAVIWGCVRDRAQLAALDFGVVALGVTPRKSASSGAGRIGDQIVIGGMRFAPGDILVADIDGVLIFPAGGPKPE